MARQSVPRDRLLLVAFFLSGAAALGYELLWTRLLGLALGNEMLGVLAVLAGFFGGMAIGAGALHDRARNSKNPVRLFVVLELVAAAYAVGSPYILHALAGAVPPALGEAEGLALPLLIAGGALLPGTFCMGATLPALVEARRRVVRGAPDGRGVGLLYAVNTAGATVGVLATVHFVLPQLGISGGALALSLVGVAAAVVARSYGQANHKAIGTPVAGDDAPKIDARHDPDDQVGQETWLLLIVAAATGLAGVGLEVVGVRVLSQLLENTVYTFAHVLAVFLIGTAAGAALYTRYAAEAIKGRPATVAAAMLIALALLSTFATMILAQGKGITEWAAGDGASYGAHFASEFLVAALVFGPPTVVMGALLSHILGLLAPRGVGRAYALNTLGSAAAPIVFAVWVIPEAGYRDSMIAVAWMYIAIFGVFTWFRRFLARYQIVPILAVVLVTALAPKSLVLIGPDEGWDTVAQSETAMGLVIVSQRPGNPPLRRLQVGRHFRMGGAMAFGERRMGQIPLLLHDAPRRALYLGIGTGATLGAVVDHDLEHVDAVELVPAVLDQLEHFDDINREVRNAENVKLHAADARRFLAASDATYDVIVADLFHPGRDGAGGLYSLEHFTAARDHLAEGGAFTQWLPLYQLDEETMRTIIRTFVAVFPDAHAFLGIYNTSTPAVALVGTNGLRLDVPRLRERLSAKVFQSLLMQDPRDMLGAYLMGGEGLSALAGDGPLNTDLQPWVLLHAPRAAYESDPERGWRNLQRLLENREPLPEDALVGEGAGELRTGAQRFADALGLYLAGEAIRMREPDRTAPPGEAVDRYLEAYDVAPEFPPARGMLYSAASQSGDQAERIFPRMLERTPDEVRVYRAYIAYLRRIKDAEREAAVTAQLQQVRAGAPD